MIKLDIWKILSWINYVFCLCFTHRSRIICITSFFVITQTNTMKCCTYYGNTVLCAIIKLWTNRWIIHQMVAVLTNCWINHEVNYFMCSMGGKGALNGIEKSEVVEELLKNRSTLEITKMISPQSPHFVNVWQQSCFLQEATCRGKAFMQKTCLWRSERDIFLRGYSSILLFVYFSFFGGSVTHILLWTCIQIHAILSLIIFSVYFILRVVY